MEHSSLTEKSSRKESGQSQTRSLQQEQSPDPELLPAQAALKALLAGAGLEQLDPEGAQALAGRAGNSTLLALLARRQSGLRLEQGPPLAQPATPPLPCTPGPPQLVEPPGLEGAPFPAGAPLNV